MINTHYDVCNFLNYNTYNDLSLYEVGTQKCRSDYSFGPIIREHYILHYVYNGEGTLNLNKHIYHVKKNEVFVLPPNITTTYQADSENPWNYIWLHFDGIKAVEFLRKAGISISKPVLPINSGIKLINYMENILKNSSNEVYCIGMLYLFFYELIENSSRKIENKKTDTSLNYVKAIIDFISVKYYEPIHVQDLVNLCGLERSYLTRMFKNVTGHSPQQYLLSYRMKMAKHLLKDTRFTVEYVANSVGYTDPFSFSKSFKKYTGVSPRRFRKLSEEGIEIPQKNGL